VVAEEGFRVLEVAGEEGWEEWGEVPTFADSGSDDPHFQLDPIQGELWLGPAVREPEGALHQHGAVPLKGAALRLRSYRTGGGRQGNLAARTLRVLKSSIPYVSSVENRHPARGGVDGEDIEEAKVRGPIALRTGNRAVTAEDYELLAREAAPDVARIRCVPAGDGGDPGAVRLLVVPAAADQAGKLRFEQLVPTAESVEKIARYLDERRVIGARVAVEPPAYQGITIVARLKAQRRMDTRKLRGSALERLYEYFHPIRGGPDGSGWPFGRPVLKGEIYTALQRVRGVELVEDVRLFSADATTGHKSNRPSERIDLQPHALVFSYEHTVQVEETQ
jgi:predicted phage baseplate assembly protein